MILQGLLAGIAVGIGVVRVYWARLKAFFSRSQPAPAIDDRDDERNDGGIHSET
jgi:hypothetical protein